MNFAFLYRIRPNTIVTLIVIFFILGGIGMAMKSCEPAATAKSMNTMTEGQETHLAGTVQSIVRDKPQPGAAPCLLDVHSFKINGVKVVDSLDWDQPGHVQDWQLASEEWDTSQLLGPQCYRNINVGDHVAMDGTVHAGKVVPSDLKINR